MFFEQPCPTLEECLIVRAADDAADGARRVHPRRAVDAARVRGKGDGGLQPQDLEGRRPHAGEADARPRGRARACASRSRTPGAATSSRPPSSHLAASTPPDTLFTVSFMNDWTNEHVAGSRAALAKLGSAPRRPGRASASPSTLPRSARRCSRSPPEGQARGSTPARPGAVALAGLRKDVGAVSGCIRHDVGGVEDAAVRAIKSPRTR